MSRDAFHALADPTRRAILLLLATQAMTPGALAEHFDSSRQAVSKHIQVLSESDLLDREQQGREVLYRLRPERLKEVDRWLERLRDLTETRFNQLDDVLNNLKSDKA